jgi:hypothetical protein
MRWLLELLRALLRHRPKNLVRPWALLAPTVVLLVTLPLLRPLRNPDPAAATDDERALLATAQSVGERGTLAIDESAFADTRRKVEVPSAPPGRRWFADQPPTLGYALGGVYYLMTRTGLTFATDGPRAAYFLILFGSAIPAALAAGLVYRMGRLFELRRGRRALLAVATVLGTGLVSYATYLNPHAPAAALLIAAAACLVHLAIAQKRPVVPFWLFAAGLCAAAAAVTDPSAIPFVPLLLAVCFGFRWPYWRRAVAAVVFTLGAVGPIALHVGLTVGVTGDAFQGVGYRPTTDAPGATDAHGSAGTDRPPGTARPPGTDRLGPSADDPDEPATGWRSAGELAASVLAALAGAHGLLSHFPILALGGAGVTMVMHRHWPRAAKVLAAGTLAGGAFLVIAYAAHRPPAVGWRDAMFAARWFVVFGPLTLFWAGAWLRRPHRRPAWVLAGATLAFSVAVGVVGAVAGPWPREGFARYTAAEALARLWRGGDRREGTSVDQAVTRQPPDAAPLPVRWRQDEG